MQNHILECRKLPCCQSVQTIVVGSGPGSETGTDAPCLDGKLVAAAMELQGVRLK